ncbi:hypothetical protein [Hymenobacter sp. HDW8]|uniref:hypothetical protein n=1 Tax=Hymenobacter sp. HDW8 TaxID=2714932 RepID=UPI0014096544|nr:hypothetical protein [Hymenobacter sp. HDW8]QIL78457.1 hypothetical protein G7064_21795 [Hymenobacter sp. HDW8]
MEHTDTIHPDMISEFTHTEEFALKMKAWSFLRAKRFGMTVAKVEALFGITNDVAMQYEREWAEVHNYVYA